MNQIVEVTAAEAAAINPYEWMGRVLAHFADAEQAIGRLCVALGLPITNGSLASMAALRARLGAAGERKCNALEKRIERWVANRPFRHLLAHATVTCLVDGQGNSVLVTRHLPRDQDDVTPDRLWTGAEQRELLRQAANDGRSISDHVAGIIADPALLLKLRKPQAL